MIPVCWRMSSSGYSVGSPPPLIEKGGGESSMGVGGTRLALHQGNGVSNGAVAAAPHSLSGNQYDEARHPWAHYEPQAFMATSQCQAAV